MPTTIALRHRDKFLDGVSKQRFHTAITAKLGIAMPTAEEESASPDKADDILKPGGIVSCFLGITYGLRIAKVLQVVPPHFDPVHLTDPGLAAGLTLLISLAFLAAWLLYFAQGAVRRMVFVYAERLFECLPSLSSSTTRKKPTRLSTD